MLAAVKSFECSFFILLLFSNFFRHICTVIVILLHIFCFIYFASYVLPKYKISYAKKKINVVSVSNYVVSSKEINVVPTTKQDTKHHLIKYYFLS